MFLGKITGKVTTGEFKFEAEATVRKLDYVAIKDPEGKWVLGYIDSIERFAKKIVAKVQVIGYRDSRGFLKTPKIPFRPQTPVFSADEEFIKKTLGLAERGAYLGLLEGYNIKVNLNIKPLVTKHIAVLAKTGAGKSYAVGVLLEEFIENKIPVLVIDPHGEYYTLREPNNNPKELQLINKFGISPKSYKSNVKIFGLEEENELKLNAKLTANEIFQLIPKTLSSTQKGILYSALENLKEKEYTLKDLIKEVEKSKSQAKWNLISILESLESTKLFSMNPTKPKSLIKRGMVSIINLRDANPEIQQIIVYKLLKDLFLARKKGEIPEFFIVLEESHNFCPERGFGEVVSSKIIRTIASEGRKFGVGLCIVSQRPAKVDKNVLSQCNTQIILKVTNPNDLKAIVNSLEGVTSGMKEEIRDLPVGIALVVGATENPIVVDIRTRRSKHGGETIKVGLERKLDRREKLIFVPKCSGSDIKKVFKGIEIISILNYPLWKAKCDFKGIEINFYVDGVTGEIIFEKDGKIETSSGLRNLVELSPENRDILYQLNILKKANLETLAEKINVDKSKLQKNINELLDTGYIGIENGEIFSKIKLKIPEDLSIVQLTEEPQPMKPEGLILDFMVSTDFVKEICKLWDAKLIQTEEVYYPFFLIQRKTRKLLIDCISGKVDLERSKVIKDFIE